MQQQQQFLYSFFLTIFTCIVFIIARLIYLQYYHTEYFTLKSNKNFLRLTKQETSRGDIIDRNGKILATNTPIYSLTWQGTGKKRLSSQQRETIAQLEKILPHRSISIDALLKAEIHYKKIILFNNLSHQEIARISELFSQDNNLIITHTFQRLYPYGHYTSHLIGYLGTDINQGKTGLEKIFQSSLEGSNGTLINAINSYGKHIESFELKKPLPGGTLQTTLDMELQTIAENIFPSHLTGALLLLDAENGDILTSISRPTFDPHLFLKPIPHKEWAMLQDQATFLNRTLTLYPPGSIFKLVTISAALEEKIIAPDATWQCKGYSVFCGRKYFCAHKKKHGTLSLQEAVAQSCNTLFFEIGKKIDIDIIARYAHLFGLGEETGFLLKEPKGIIPTKHWKLINKHEPWWPGETLSVAIGQSFLLVSLLQITRMIGSIFTGFLIKPRILLNEPIEKKPLLIQQQTLNFLQESMDLVIKSGTGKQMKKIENLEIYAKTSTAQISSLEKSHLDKTCKEHGWFATYFNYKKQGPLILVILVEKAGTAQISTTIAKNFIINYKKWCDTKSSNNFK